MLVSSLFSIGFAITSFYVSVKIANQIWQLLAALIALFCFILSFTFSPVPIEVMIALALLITTQKIHTLNENS